MTLRADYLVDRRKLKRSITLWRVLTVFAVLALVATIVLQNDRLAAAIGYRPHVARMEISGIIRADHDRLRMLKKIAESDSVKAVVLRINSPGGTAIGGEALHNALLKVREKKPVVAVFSTVATSAAYMAGIASDHIVARGGTITGSVGVILQWAEVTELMDKLGIRMEEVKSGALKAVPSPFSPLDEAGRELTREMVDEAQNWFVALVGKSRSIDPRSVPGLTEGRIYSGRQALDHKLIDQIGGEEDAIAWLEKERGIEKDLKIIDWEVEDESGTSLLSGMARILAEWTGFPASAVESALGGNSVLERVQLDGLVSVWHAQRAR